MSSESEDYENQSDSEDYETATDPVASGIVSNSEGRVTRLDEGLKTKIFSILNQIKTPSTFAYSAVTSTLPNPALYVWPYGILGLPLSTDDAQKIISQASQSPFGKGEETLVDTTVRKSWELNPNQFALENPSWNQAMEIIVDSVIRGLGLGTESGKVTAELYKLLLYEPGAFFKPHKDSEKSPGMFATLVVCLPSPHEGGKVVISHANEVCEFETAKPSRFSCSYAAWYSDVTHEVLPVVSGHRLVLVYNLIRPTNCDIPSHNLVRGRVKQLVTLLEQYNARLEEGDSELPPILLHKLEHKYTQANLNISTLKPPDLGQVQALRQVVAELGFDIFLATLELEVKKEYEYEPDREDREQRLKNVVKLDGDLFTDEIDAPAGALTDPAGQKEDKYVMKERGYRGNEGKPDTYWYRDTVVALVPPSRKLHLVFKFKFTGSIIEPLFCQLMQQFSQSPARKPELEHLCKLALKQVPKKHYDYRIHGYTEDIPAFFRQAAATALDLGRVDLFDEAYKTLCDKIMLDDAHELGRLAAVDGVAAMTDRLTNCVQIMSSIAKKVEFLEAVGEGFKMAVPQANSAERVSFEQWSKEAILTAVAKLTMLTTADTVSLARLCKTTDWRQFELKAKPIISNAAMMTKITFMNELMSAPQELDEKQRSFLDTIIRSIWSEFVFEVESSKSVPQVATSSSRLQSQTNPSKVAFSENNLLHIIKNTITVLSSASSEFVETTMIPAILSAIPAASKDCTKNLFIFLVQKILKNELAGFELPFADILPPPSHKRLVQALLTKYLLAHVDHEPQAPTDWSLPAGSCECSDCVVVNTFLRDPLRESLDFRCAQPRREHLSKIFHDYSRYDIWTIRGPTPYVWRMTKHRRAYDRAKLEWENKIRSAKEPLLALKNSEPVSGRLYQYLDPYYETIMNVDIVNLPKNENGLKRVADTSLSEDELAKRKRVQVSNSF